MPKIYMKDFFVHGKEIKTVASFRKRGTFTFQFERVFKLYMQLMFKRNVSRMK